jgi:tetratricopeptide (TPR) repeat protein
MVKRRLALHVVAFIVTALIVPFIAVPLAHAEVVTIKKSYSYTAGPLDDEFSSRVIALTKVKLVLFNVVAGYLEDFEGAAVLSPGIVTVQEIGQSWNGRVYTVEAATAFDPGEIADSIGILGTDVDRPVELKRLRQRVADALREVENLNEQGDLRQYLRYEELVNELVAVDAMERGYAAITRGDYPVAVKSFTSSIDTDRKDAAAFYNRGAAQWMLENYRLALEDFKKALELDRGYKRAKQSIEQAEAFFEKIEDTVSYFDNAIAVNPVDVGLYYERGLAHWELGNYDNAIRDFTMVAKLSPDVEDGFINRGGVYLTLEEYEAALQDFKAAVEVNPKSTMAHFNLGLLNLRRGRYEDAVESFTRVIELEPSDSEALYNRGVVYDELGRSKEAILDMREAAKLGKEAYREGKGSRGSA